MLNSNCIFLLKRRSNVYLIMLNMKECYLL